MSRGARLRQSTNSSQRARSLPERQISISLPPGWSARGPRTANVRNLFDPRYIAGGSSSGSGVAVSAGQVSFAFGTDTAGSGRVPAAFNNIVGLKPSRGRISTVGVVPACRSLDCVSILALTCADAALRSWDNRGI